VSTISDTSGLAAVNQSPTVRVARSLREWIHGGQWSPGERLPPEMDLVQRLSVSRGTIRTALQQLTDEGLVVELPGRGRKSRGRIVAPAVRNGGGGLMARTVGLITHGLGALSDNPIRYAGGRAELAVGAASTQALHAAGMHVLSISAGAFEESEVSHFITNAPFGVIATYPACSSPRVRPLLERLAARGVRVVVTGHDSGREGVASSDNVLVSNIVGDNSGLDKTAADNTLLDRVISDHETGAYELTRWLIARGHRRIVEMSSGPPDRGWLSARTRGYGRAMREAGLEPLPRVSATNVDPAFYSDGTTEAPTRRERSTAARESFERRVRQIAGFVAGVALGGDPVDAIMASNDWDASLILAACRLLGMVPNQRVVVVGYDDWVDNEEREWEPAIPLATVDKRNADVGREAVRLLIERVEGKLPASPQIRLVKPRLVELCGEVKREAEEAELAFKG
jgi:DNA-binding LacI/PurR family transcriptional regulator